MGLENRNKGEGIFGCIVMIISGVLHIAFGALYLQTGDYLQSLLLTFAPFLAPVVNTGALAAFTITMGIIFILWNFICLITLAKQELKSLQFQRALWTLGWVNVVFSFAVAFMEVWEYSRLNQVFQLVPIDPSNLNSAIYNSFYFALADSIITFVLAFPSALGLLNGLNNRLICSEQRTLLKIVPNVNSEESQILKSRLIREEAKLQEILNKENEEQQ